MRDVAGAEATTSHEEIIDPVQVCVVKAPSALSQQHMNHDLLFLTSSIGLID